MKGKFCHNKVFRPLSACLRNPRGVIVVIVNNRRKLTKKSTYCTGQTPEVAQDSMPFWKEQPSPGFELTSWFSPMYTWLAVILFQVIPNKSIRLPTLFPIHPSMFGNKQITSNYPIILLVTEWLTIPKSSNWIQTTTQEFSQWRFKS